MSLANRFTLALLMVLFGSAQSFAQGYPSKPIRIIIGFPVGSGTDIGARVVSNELSKRVGQPLVVENRVGANGSIAADAVMKSPPDGYTINFGSVMNFHPMFVLNGAIDAAKELTPVSNSMSGVYVLYSSAKVPVNNFQELVAYAKANPPGKLNFASASSSIDLLGVMLKDGSGITYTNVPYYTGSAPAVIAAISNGEAAFTFSILAGFAGPVQSGAAKPLMYSAPKRHPQYPNLPTARELGLPKFENSAFNFGYWAARGVPKDILDRLSREAAASATAPEVAAQVRKVGFEPVGSTAEEQMHTFTEEVKFWAEAVRLANFKPQ
jgi:tripartite-type tricarboxylate transporter receptor subunit TctC